jgi:very-short-patch-repair endonuclease
MVHQRVGAPLRRIRGRLVTAPAWTAVEMARSLRRPRALAVLDAAVRSMTCTLAELRPAADEQKGRRGIVNVRDLLPHVDARAESAMESEARLVFIDGGIPPSKLQHEIVDRCGDLWRVDFAWPEAMVAAEYDSMEWHANPTVWKRDRIKTARLQDCGWTLVRFVVDDVRRHPVDLVERVANCIETSRLAG